MTVDRWYTLLFYRTGAPEAAYNTMERTIDYRGPIFAAFAASANAGDRMTLGLGPDNYAVEVVDEEQD